MPLYPISCWPNFLDKKTNVLLYYPHKLYKITCSIDNMCSEFHEREDWQDMNNDPLYSDDFDSWMERIGYPREAFNYQPIDSGLKVIGQRSDTSEPPNTRTTPESFYYKFGNNKFRKLLRHLFDHHRCTYDELKNNNINKQTLDQCLEYLSNSGIALLEGNYWIVNPLYHDIKDIGATLEWYIANWFRLALEAPSRHGLYIAGMPEGGDLDVVAFLGETRIMVECKSGNPQYIEDEQLHLFLHRTAIFKPGISLLLIDTESKIDVLFEKIRKVYATSKVIGPGNENGLNIELECVHIQNVRKSIIQSLYATLESHSSSDMSDRPPSQLAGILGHAHPSISSQKGTKGDPRVPTPPNSFPAPTRIERKRGT